MALKIFLFPSLHTGIGLASFDQMNILPFVVDVAFYKTSHLSNPMTEITYF